MGLGERGKDLGLLILRIGIGILFVYHGVGILGGGQDAWVKTGGAMSYVGVSFMPAAWGFCAGAVMTVGGVFLAFGVFVRLFALLMLISMLVATNMHLQMGQGFGVASHAIESAVVFLSLFFMGSGRYYLKLPKKHSTDQPQK